MLNYGGIDLAQIIFLIPNILFSFENETVDAEDHFVLPLIYLILVLQSQVSQLDDLLIRSIVSQRKLKHLHAKYQFHCCSFLLVELVY